MPTQIGLFLQVRGGCYLASYNQFTSQGIDRTKVSFCDKKAVIIWCTIDLIIIWCSQPLVKDAQIKLTGMVYQLISDGNLKFAQLLRNALVDKV